MCLDEELIFMNGVKMENYSWKLKVSVCRFVYVDLDTILSIAWDIFNTFNLMEEDIVVELGTYLFDLESKKMTRQTMKKIKDENDVEELWIERDTLVEDITQDPITIASTWTIIYRANEDNVINMTNHQIYTKLGRT